MNRRLRAFNSELEAWEFLDIDDSQLGTSEADKNGNEIFEGDFVLLENWNDHAEDGDFKDEIRKVVWADGCFFLWSIVDDSNCTMDYMNNSLALVVGSDNIPPRFESFNVMYPQETQETHLI